jgi:hypothetical protein
MQKPQYCESLIIPTAAVRIFASWAKGTWLVAFGDRNLRVAHSFVGGGTPIESARFQVGPQRMGVDLRTCQKCQDAAAKHREKIDPLGRLMDAEEISRESLGRQPSSRRESARNR